MKERRYHALDIINIITFYCVFLCFLVAFVFKTIGLINGTAQLYSLLFVIAFIFIMCIPYFLKKVFKIVFSKFVNIIFYLYMFLAAFLGTVVEFYQSIAVWDMVIHFLMGFVLAILSIYILNVTVYKKDKSRHNLILTLIFMMAFAMGVSALWEIWEFMGDLLFGLNSQRTMGENMVPLVGQKAVMDTMIDLWMDFLGSIFAVIFVGVASKFSKGFLKSFTIKKLKKKEVEDIEE